MARPNPPEFWLRKMRSFFVLHDRDLDGVVRRQDFVDYPCDRAKHYLGVEKAGDFRRLVTQAWGEFMGGSNETVTLDEIVDKFGRTFSQPHLADVHAIFAGWMFKAVDINNDDMANIDEYTKILQCFGVHPLSVPPAFQALDLDQDGLISKEEFVKAGQQFFQCTGDSPGTLFWGPLLA